MNLNREPFNDVPAVRALAQSRITARQSEVALLEDNRTRSDSARIARDTGGASSARAYT